MGRSGVWSDRLCLSGGLPLTLTLSPEGRGDWFGVGVWLVRWVLRWLRAPGEQERAVLFPCRNNGASVELCEWLLGGCRAGTPERTAVRDGVRFGGQRRRRRSATRDFCYWQASQSGLSMEHASGTGAGFGSAAGAALAEFAASLPPLDTAFSLPVLMVDFSVLVAARARR